MNPPPTWTGTPPPRSAAPSPRSAERSPCCWWPTTGRPGNSPTTSWQWRPAPRARPLPTSQMPTAAAAAPAAGAGTAGRDLAATCRDRPSAAGRSAAGLHESRPSDPGHRRVPDTRAAGRRAAAEARARAVPRPPGSAACWHRSAAKFAAAGAVGTLAALFAVALAGLSGWLIIRASEQPPILYLLTAIVGVRFFGIGRAGPALPRTPPAARRRLRRPDPAPRQALGIAEPPGALAAPAAAGRQRPGHGGGRRRHGPGPAAPRGPAAR